MPTGKGTDELVATVEFGAAEQDLDRLATVGRVGADRRGKDGMRRAKTAPFVKGPKEARIRRRGPLKTGSGGSSGGRASRPPAGGGGSAVAAPRAGIDAKSKVVPAGARTRTQRKLTLVGRRSMTKRMPSSRGGRPIGNVAARWRKRRALGPSPRTSRASRASVSSTPNKASSAGLASTMRAGGLAIANRALSLSHSVGASRRSKAAAPSCDWTAGSGADGDGE